MPDPPEIKPFLDRQVVVADGIARVHQPINADELEGVGIDVRPADVRAIPAGPIEPLPMGLPTFLLIIRLADSTLLDGLKLGL